MERQALKARSIGASLFDDILAGQAAAAAATARALNQRKLRAEFDEVANRVRNEISERNWAAYTAWEREQMRIAIDATTVPTRADRIAEWTTVATDAQRALDDLRFQATWTGADEARRRGAPYRAALAEAEQALQELGASA